MLLDEFLPDYDVADRHRVAVGASVGRVYDAVRALDMGGSAMIRTLFFLRELPALLTARNRGGERRLGLTLDGLIGSGFVLLGERPGREILLGLVGRFWTPSGDLRRVRADEFRGFATPGYAKAAWSFFLTPQDPETTLLLTETRVLCLDPASRTRFRRYWSFVGPFSGVIRKEVLRGIKREAEHADPKTRYEP